MKTQRRDKPKPAVEVVTSKEEPPSQLKSTQEKLDDFLDRGNGTLERIKRATWLIVSIVSGTVAFLKQVYSLIIQFSNLIQFLYHLLIPYSEALSYLLYQVYSFFFDMLSYLLHYC